MIGPITVGKKAAALGYRKYGVPGAIATGTAGAVGYVAARRVLKRAVATGGETNEQSSDASGDDGDAAITE